MLYIDKRCHIRKRNVGELQDIVRYDKIYIGMKINENDGFEDDGQNKKKSINQLFS